MERIKRWLLLQRIRIRTLAACRLRNWRTIPIRECREPLVEVPPEICHPYYAREMKLVTDTRIFVREQVLKRLLTARDLLKVDGFDLKVYDGWRSVTLQANLFWYYLKRFTVKRFQLEEHFSNAQTPEEVRLCYEQLGKATQGTLLAANRTYVSWPSANLENPSPHATGGAVDVWLFRDGKPEDLGVPFDWMKEDAGAFYHLKFRRKRFPGNDQRVCRNRSKLILAMTHAGFSCYGPELWHFNCGNQMHALVKGGPARYSYIEP